MKDEMTCLGCTAAGPTSIIDGVASGIQAQCGASPRSGLQLQRASVNHPSTGQGSWTEAMANRGTPTSWAREHPPVVSVSFLSLRASEALSSLSLIP